MEKTELVYVLFCGLVREPELFKKSINDFVLMKKEGLIKDILYSTWIGEVEKYPEIDSFLKEAGVIIIKSEEPKERGYGSIWCQMKALEEGLKKVDSGSFVLKTRSDVYINNDFLKKLFKRKKELLKITKNLPKGNVFQYKVWVPWYEITRPFYIGDEAFFGLKEDLKLLINYDKTYDIDYKIGTGLCHIRRYIHPFIKDYPILQEYLSGFKYEGAIKSWAVKNKKMFDFRKISFLRTINRIKKFRDLRKRLKNEKYIEILASYYSIVNSHFYINGDDYVNQVIFEKAGAPSKKLDPIFIEKNFSQEKAVSDYGAQINDYNEILLKNICEKKLAETNFSKKLMEDIDKFNKIS